MDTLFRAGQVQQPRKVVGFTWEYEAWGLSSTVGTVAGQDQTGSRHLEAWGRAGWWDPLAMREKSVPEKSRGKS